MIRASSRPRFYQSACVGGCRVRRDGRVTVGAGNASEVEEYPDPLSFIAELDDVHAAFQVPIHGQVNATTVLVSPACETWLIGFEHAGPGALADDFASLEVSIA